MLFLLRDAMASATAPLSRFARFTQILMRQFGQADVHSPLSIYSAFHLLGQTATGPTHELLCRTLGSLDDGVFGKLRHDLTSTGHLKIDDLILHRGDVPIKEDFKEVMLAKDTGLISFESPKDGVEQSNKWVEKKTNGLIPSLLEDSDLDADTAFVLLNTVYFLGKWKNPFDAKNSRERDFTKFNGSKSKVSLMTNKERYGYFENKDLQFLRMDYDDSPFSMGVVLPKKEMMTRLPELNDLNLFQELMKSSPAQTVEVYFPKFTHRTRTDLTEMLDSLDLSALKEKITLGKMTDETMPLFVSKVIHEAVVCVDEEKTEAAAATSIVATRECCVVSLSPVFMADHSFIYFIAHRPSNTMLFIGNFDGVSA